MPRCLGIFLACVFATSPGVPALESQSQNSISATITILQQRECELPIEGVYTIAFLAEITFANHSRSPVTVLGDAYSPRVARVPETLLAGLFDYDFSLEVFPSEDRRSLEVAPLGTARQKFVADVIAYLTPQRPKPKEKDDILNPGHYFVRFTGESIRARVTNSRTRVPLSFSSKPYPFEAPQSPKLRPDRDCSIHWLSE